MEGDDEGCVFSADAFYDPDMTEEEITPYRFNPEELRITASLNGLSLEEDDATLCATLQERMPGFAGLRRQILWLFTEIAEEDRQLVLDYQNYDFIGINRALRSNPLGEARINDIIAQAPPLERDIVVYRSVERKLKLPEAGTVFRSYGYLSTSLKPVIDRLCKNPKMRRVLLILVPAGTRCIFLPGYEHELIFAHNIRLLVLGCEETPILCHINLETGEEKWVNGEICNMRMLSGPASGHEDL
jgi:hypothetical protein